MHSRRAGFSQTAPHKHPGLQRPGPVLAERAVGSVAQKAGQARLGLDEVFRDLARGEQGWVMV